MPTILESDLTPVTPVGILTLLDKHAEDAAANLLRALHWHRFFCRADGTPDPTTRATLARYARAAGLHARRSGSSVALTWGVLYPEAWHVDEIREAFVAGWDDATRDEA